jgi:L-lactate dehydrogenase complex protein LldG
MSGPEITLGPRDLTPSPALAVNERPGILARIREALRVPAARPGFYAGPGQRVLTHEEKPTDFKPWLPVVGASFEDRVALFAKNAAELKADFQLLASRDELAAKLSALAKAEGWKKIGTHAGEMCNFAFATLGLPVVQTDSLYKAEELEVCDAAITECDALVAQTGTVVLTTRSAGGRALSILPPHHVVLARREQLLPDLPAAFALLKQRYADNYPSMMCLITGPSRTGDIERILVLGAHGPKKLTIFCV